MDDDCDGTQDNGFACIAGTSSTCTTVCGSTGGRACLGDCSFDICAPPMETCNGVDDDCDAAPDDGFDCVRGTMTTCTTSCGSTGTRTCRNSCTYGACNPPAEGCTGMDDDCDGSVDEGAECTVGEMRSCTTSCGSTGTETCGGSCTYGGCTPPSETCNGADDDCDGACDDGVGSCCAGSTADCATLGMGFSSGTATCRSDCSGYDTSTCSLCGNGTIDGSEECDDPDYDGATCESIGAGSGTLGCTSLCTYDTSSCAGFDPTGIFDLSSSPIYSCAFGLVNYNFSSVNFFDDGATLIVSNMVVPCTMSGPSARTSMMFDLTCTVPGVCAETYSLSGMFTSANTWTGTFTASFMGTCIDCVNQSVALSGTRR
jgi:hypothetical protein